jgi:hypothetical protein
MPDANEMMMAYASDAVDYAAKLKKTLDYSEASIATVEEICDLLHKAIPRSFWKRLLRKKPSDPKILQYSKMLGGYLGEVMRRTHGGNWAVENINNEGNTIVLTIADIKLFPVGRVYKRLKEGAENNTQDYYSVLRSMINKDSFPSLCANAEALAQASGRGGQKHFQNL